jgi:hypothetical protein
LSRLRRSAPLRYLRIDVIPLTWPGRSPDQALGVFVYE